MRTTLLATLLALWLSAPGFAAPAPQAAASPAAASPAPLTPPVPAMAPAPPTPGYDPLETFAPLTLPEPVNRYRSGDGAPGPDYWQNRADYEIAAHARSRDQDAVSGDETITYTNNSPDALDALWLQLDQNIYRKDARAGRRGGRRRGSVAQVTDGFVLDAVEIENGGKPSRPTIWSAIRACRCACPSR